MPTSGEARIRPTSTYNLRSRPLPTSKTKPAIGRTIKSTSSKNKENVSDSANKPKKSQIPVPVKVTPIGKQKAADLKGSTGGSRSKSRVKTVPDFAKLHKTWQQSFNKGKACSKKQCTQVQEFDLTKPGTVFQPSYCNSQEASAPAGERGDEDEDVFQKDDDALQSILNGGLPTAAASQERSRLTAATGNGYPGADLPKPSRQTLGALPSAYLPRANITQQMGNWRNVPVSGPSTKAGYRPLEQDQPENPTRRKLSLAEQQQEIDINFEPDAGALASILNNTGANFQRQAPATRQTIGVAMGASKSHGAMFSGRQSQGPTRTSIYFQKSRNKNYNQVYTDFANHVLSRLSLAENTAPPPSHQPLVKTTMRSVSKSTIVAQPGSKAASQPRLLMSAPRRIRTPATASRVGLNPRYQASLRGQVEASSPALRAPPSAMKKASRAKEGKAQSVKWADVLSPPGERTAHEPAKDELATALFADEDTQYMEPYVMNRALEKGELQAACFMAKQDEIQQLEQQAAMHRNKLEEMDEIERQLELEIQKLQEEEEDPFPSLPTLTPKNQAAAENPSHLGFDSCCPEKLLSPTSSSRHTSEKSQGTGHIPPSGFLLTPQQGLTARPLIIGNSVVGERGGISEDVRLVKSPEAAFSHSPGSPFRRKHTSGESDFGQLKPSGTKLSDGTSQDASNVSHLDLQRQFKTAGLTEKPFSVNGMVHQVEVQDPRIFQARSDTEMMAPQVISQSRDGLGYEQTAAAVSIQQPPGSISQDLGHLQEFSGGSVRNVGQGASSWGATHPQMGQALQLTPGDGMINHQSEELQRGRLQFYVQNQIENGHGKEQEQVPSSRTTGANLYPAAPSTETGFHQDQSEPVNFQNITPFVRPQPSYSSPRPEFSVLHDRINSQVHSNKLQTPSRDMLSDGGVVLSVESFRPPFATTSGSSFPEGRPTSWLSSTPARIQTPHAVQPHSMVKELALRSALPTLGLSGNPRTEFIQDAPPIHTPLAMRTISRWTKDVESGASPLQFVSPIAVRANLTADPTPATTETSLAEAAIGKPHHPSSGIHSICAPAVTTSFATEASGFNHLQQMGVRVDSRSATAPAEGSTKPGFRPVHHQGTGVMLDPLSASTTRDPKEIGIGKVNAVGVHSGSSNCLKARAQGSLSLGAELMTSGGAAAFLKSKMKPLLTSTTNQLFQEALLDEECALYACRLPSKFSHAVPERLCFNPVAKILMDGDDMHFVPIQSKGSVYISSPLGSAFNMYSNQ